MPSAEGHMGTMQVLIRNPYLALGYGSTPLSRLHLQSWATELAVALLPLRCTLGTRV